jgi:hypothetical protein
MRVSLFPVQQRSQLFIATYHVNIVINSQVAGSASFALRYREPF